MKRIQLAIAVFAIIFTLTITSNFVKAETTTMWTDKQDYSPEETVTIYGKDFVPDTMITIILTRPDGHIDTWAAYSDSSAQFTTTYLLDGITGTYTVTATDGTNTATTTFTDSPKVGFVTVGSQSPNPVMAGNNATYTVTVIRGSGGGSSGAFTADLTITTALPTGASASFSPNPVSFGSKDDTETSTLTISTTSSTPGGSTSFTVKAATSASDYATNSTGTLAVQAADTTPPTTTISLSGTSGLSGWYVSNVGVTLTATDNVGGSGVKEIHYILDSGTEQIVSGSSATFTISTDGTHSLEYWAVDNALNVEIPHHTQMIKIDKTPPVVAISAPVNGAYYKSVNVPVKAFTVVEINPYTTVESGYSTSEGSHTYTVTATDSAGNVGSASVSYTVDNTAPVVTITAPANGAYYKTADVPVAAYTVVETNPYTTVEVGYSTVEGVHTYTVTATDGAGNPGSASVTYTVDNVAPVVTITAPANGAYYTTAAVPVGAFSVVETNPYTAVEVGYSTVEGVHTYTVTATDGAGNSGSASVTYTVDNTPPVVTITAPANGLYYKTADVPSAAFTIVEANPYTTSESGYATTEGPHTYIVTATDAAGNVGSDSVTYTVDNTAPVVTITAPANGAYYKSSAVPVAAYSVVELNPYTVVESGYSTAEGVQTYTVTATDAAGNVGSASVTYTVDNTAPVVTITAPADSAYYKTVDVPVGAFSVVELNPYSTVEVGYSTVEGVHTYTVTATDGAGNPGSNSVTYTVDNTAPVVDITAPTDGAYYKTVNLPAKAFTVTDNLDPSPSVVEGGYSTAEGAHTYTVTATDAAGNVGSDSVTYTVDNTAPVVTITAPTVGAYYKSSAVPIGAFTVVELNPYITVESGYSTVEGVQTYTVTATDGAGNVGSASVTYTVDNTPPVVTITAPANGAYYKTADVPTAAYSVVELNPYTLTETGYSTNEGVQTYTVTAIDAAGNVGAASVTYTVDNTAPVVTITAPADGAYYTTVNVPAKAFSVDEINPYTTAEAGYSTSEGHNTYTVTATDGAGNVGSDSVTYTVDNTAPVVTITAPANGAYYKTANVPSASYAVVELNPYTVVESGYSTAEGVQTYTVTATDSAGNVGSASVTYTVDNTAPIITITAPANGAYYKTADVPAGAFSVAEINPYTTVESGWANSPDGSKTYTVTATDDAGNSGSASVTYTVDNVAPVVTITAPADGAYYKTINVPAKAFTVVETNPYTTVESGYSTAEGVHTYTVTATDGAGNVGSDYVTYTVDNTAPVVTITAPVDGGHYNVGTVPSLTYTVVESNPYTTSESEYSTTKGTHTVTVTATDAAGNVGSDSATYTVGETALTYTGATSGEYSDSVTVSATLEEVATDTPLSGKTISFAIGSQTVTATTDASGVATTSITLTQPSGSYTVAASFAGDTNYLSSSDSEPFTIYKETVTITYTGDTLVFTAGPTISTAPVRLSAILVQEDDGYKGDLTLAKVRFELFKSSNMGTTPDIVVDNVPVNAAGEALTTATLGVDVWTVFVKIEPTNPYWKPSEVVESILTVDYGSNERKVTGGGWIPDSQSANGKGNFGFTVNYNKNGAPKGSFVYVFRGKDGYNYVVKSNSWQGGGLSFSGTNKAYFAGKCNVQKIDRATGAVVASWGNYRFAVDITDGDLDSPRTTDKIAITIFDETGAIWRQIGTPTNPITLGGGNIVIHSKQQ
jgi:hypothetical protein